MNLAFPTFIALFLVVPGLLHRFAFNGRFTKSQAQSFPSFTLETLLVLASALGLHWIAIAFVQLFLQHYTGIRVDIDATVYLLAGNYTDQGKFQSALQAIANYSAWIATYALALFLLAVFSGRILRKVVRLHLLDIRYSWIRFQNFWHYLFSGEALIFPPEGDVPALWGVEIPTRKPVAGTIISLVIDTKSEAVLYVGLLRDYTLGKSGELDQIILSDTVRRSLAQDDLDRKDGQLPEVSNPLKRYYKIDGDFQVFRYAEVRNLNVKYLFVQAPPIATAVDAAGPTS